MFSSFTLSGRAVGSARFSKGTIGLNDRSNRQLAIDGMLIDSSTGEWVHPDYFKVAALSNFEDVENWLRTFTLRQIYETPCPCQQPGGTGFQCNLNSEIRFRHAGRNGNVAKVPRKIDRKMGQIWDRRLGAPNTKYEIDPLE